MDRRALQIATSTLAFFLFAGCGEKSNELQSSPPRANRPEVLQRSLFIEKEERSITLKLFDATKTTLPLRFTTYSPDDMIPEVKSEREGDSVRFVAAFGGRRNADEYLGVFIEVQGRTEAEARGIARMAAIARGLVERPPDQPKLRQWALSEYDFAGSGPKGKRVVGTIFLSRHADRYFTIVLSYPEQYAGEVMPRAEVILNEWRWQDTGQSL